MRASRSSTAPSCAARAGIGATGSHYRRLDAPGVHELLGAGVYYGSAPREAAYHRDGHVFVVGGANSAGQAALYLAEFAAHVTMVVRAKSLADGMSQYLVARCEAHPRITVRTNAQVVRALGEERLEALHIDVVGQVEIVDADALFILIGGVPTSGRVDWVRRDDAGFFLTGPDVLADGGRGTWWKLEREPMFLESSSPGIFFAGDVRHGSIKRVASAVGEGAMAVQQVHRFLAEKNGRTFVACQWTDRRSSSHPERAVRDRHRDRITGSMPNAGRCSPPDRAIVGS